MTILLIATILLSFIGFQAVIFMAFYNGKKMDRMLDKTIRHAKYLSRSESGRVRFAFHKSALTY
jgi:hypothetical protein